jgi:hypothetical protein
MRKRVMGTWSVAADETAWPETNPPNISSS